MDMKMKDKKVVSVDKAIALTILLYEFAEYPIISKLQKAELYKRIINLLPKEISQSTLERYLKSGGLIQFKDGSLILADDIKKTKVFFEDDIKYPLDKTRAVLSLELNESSVTEQLLGVNGKYLERMKANLSKNYPTMRTSYKNFIQQKDDDLRNVSLLNKR